MAEEKRSDAAAGAGTGLLALSAIAVIVSLGMIGFGWWRMYAYDEFGGDKIVGGDALNIQILSARGAGIITAGVGVGVVAVVLALMALASRLDAKW